MSNKTQLQTNNTALDGYITRINAAKDVAASLPESGGSGDESVETYDLILESDGTTKPYSITYTAYIDGEYQLHDDGNMSTLSYPHTINNVVLKSPVNISVSGGVATFRLKSDISYILAKNYNSSYGDPGDILLGFMPLTSDNGTVRVYCYDD